MNQKPDDPTGTTDESGGQPPDEPHTDHPEQEEPARDREAEEDNVAGDRESVEQDENAGVLRDDGARDAYEPERDTTAEDERWSAAEPATAGAPDALAAPVPARRGPTALAALAFLLALVSLAGVAYLGWQGRGGESADNAQAIAAVSSDLDETTADLREVQNRLEALGADGAERAGELESLEARLQGRLDELLQQAEATGPRLANLEDAISSLQGISSGVRETWMLAEAEYYLQIANAQLQLAGNPDIALLALNFADERIRQLANPGLTGVRRALSREIQALAAQERTDLEGMTLTLANLAERVASLPLDQQVAESPAEPAAVGPEAGGLSRALASVKRAFSDLVSVRRTDDPASPLMAPDAASFLRANLALQFQSARLALLRGQPAVFRQSLDDAGAWLDRYYDSESRAVQRALSTIAELLASEVEVPTPDISESLRLLRQYRSQRDMEVPAGDEPAQ